MRLAARYFWAAIVQSVMVTCVFNGMCQAQDFPAGQADANRWSVQDITAAVAWREAALADCSFAFLEKTSVGMNGKPIQECYRKNVQMRCRGGVISLTGTEEFLSWTPPEKLEWREWWDGKTSRGVFKRTRQGQVPRGLEAAVVDRMPQLLEGSRLLEAVNLSPNEFLSAKLKRLMETNQSRAQISASQVEGEPVVQLVLTDPKQGPPNLWEFSFLPNKDFILSRVHCRAYSSREFKVQTSEHEMRAANFKQMGGIWMPTTIHEERSQYAGGHLAVFNRIEAELTAFSTVRPTDEEMAAIEFPVNATVVDSVARQAYRIMPDGSRKYEPLLDSATGQVIQPPAPSTRPATK